MTKKYVLLSSDEKKVLASFVEPVDDVSRYPSYAELEDTDPRWLVYFEQLSQRESRDSLINSAQEALEHSDVTVLRCYENNIPVPHEWVVYRKALRAIVGGIDRTSTILPPEPTYPCGS